MGSTPTNASKGNTVEYLARDYRMAPSGEGPLAAEWKDKPHRLIYDLCSEVDRLEAELIGEQEQAALDVLRIDQQWGEELEALKRQHADEIERIYDQHRADLQAMEYQYEDCPDRNGLVWGDDNA